MQLYTVSNVMRRRQGSRTCGLFDAADDERISNSLDVLTGFDFGSDDESNDAVAFVGHFPTVISIGHHPTTKAKNIDPFVVAQTRTFDCVNFLHTQLQNSQLQIHSFLTYSKYINRM